MSSTTTTTTNGRTHRALLLCIVMTAVLLLPAAVSADHYYGGLPLSTVQSGVVSGGLYVDAAPPSFGPNVITKTFTLPSAAVGNVQWARLYVSAYCGNMQMDRPITITTSWDGDGVSGYETIWPETGHAPFNFVVSGGNNNSAFPGHGDEEPYMMINDHENRVTSDYFLWYDVTNRITSQTVNVNVDTTGSYDGRIKVITLVVAYNDGDSDQYYYWVNDGHDMDAGGSGGYSGSTDFDLSSFTGTADSATLTANHMASEDGSYWFDGESIATDPVTGNGQGSYSGYNIWDVTSSILTGDTNDLVYDGTGPYYKIPLATLVVKKEATVSPPVAAFTGIPASGTAPLTVLFNDESTNSPTSRVWDFGDGNSTWSTTETVFAHTYESAGTYDVTLTVSNAGGSDDEFKDDYITVTAAGPKTWYVDTTGAGDFTNIQPAINAASSGDTIYIRPGTYTSGRIYVTKENLNIIGESTDSVSITITDSAHEIDIYAPGTNLENITFQSLSIFVSSSNNTIAHTIIANTPEGYDAGLYVEGSSNTIRENLVSGASSFTGIWCWGSYNLIENNTLRDGAVAGLAIAGPDNTITKNSIINNADAGILLWNEGSAENNRFYLNTLSGNAATASTMGLDPPTTISWVSAEPITYTYNGNTYSGILGNYWDADYTGTDADGNGVGDTAYTVPESLGSDTAPLMGAWNDGEIPGPGIEAPVAAFTGTPTSGTAPLTVLFTDESTNSPTSRVWDFGDGNSTWSTAETTFAHTYTLAGTYDVTLAVSNTGGSDSEENDGYITVSGPALLPVAAFSASPLSGTAPLLVAFSDESTSSGERVANGGFTTGDLTGWTASGTGWNVVSDSRTGGQYAAVTTVPYTTLSQEIDLTGVDALSFSYVYFDDAESGIGPELHVKIDDTDVYSTPGDCSSWTTVSIDTSAYSGTHTVSWYFAEYAAAGSSLYIDDISATCKEEQVTNGGFGTGDLTGWTASGTGWNVVSDSRTGGQYAAVTTVSYTTLSQEIDLTGVDTLSFSYVYFDDAESGIGPELHVKIDDTDVYSTPGDCSSWTTVSIDTSAYSGTHTVSWYFAEYAAAGSSLYIDDISARSTPEITAWAWDFDNNGVTDSTARNPTHEYLVPGTYSVNLTVTDTNGSDSEVKTGYITVNPASGSPVAAFTGTPTTGTESLTVLFSDESTNSPTSRVWDFGDGNSTWSTTETTFAHTYALAGTYDVTLTVSNAGGSDDEAKAGYITVAAGARPDFLITLVNTNTQATYAAGNVFAKESNTVRTTVKNNGTVASPAAVLRVTASDGFTGTGTIPALTAGATAYVNVEDTTIRPTQDVTVTYTATADPDNLVAEAFEGNNVKDSAVKTVKYNGYKGARYWDGKSDVTTYKTYDLRGNLIHSFGDGAYRSGSFGSGWYSYDTHWTAANLPIPAGATVKEARLYVPYTWDYEQRAPDQITITFNGVTVPYQHWYHDVSNFGGYSTHTYGLMTYDVTSQFVKNGANTATFTRPGYMDAISPYGFTLAVVYEDANATRKQIFMNEEFDLLGASLSGYATSEEEATAYIPFTGPTIDTANVTKADLITFVPSGYGPEGTLLFNGNVIDTTVWDHGPSSGPQVAVDTRDMKAYLSPTGNEAGIRGEDSSSPCLAAAQEFLVVEYQDAPVAAFTGTPTSGTTPLTVLFTDTSSGSPTTRVWDFGDGNSTWSTTATTFAHTYVATGTYDVTLAVTNSAGSDSEVKDDFITVSDSILTIPGQANPPTDPDHDGKYEDLSGSSGTDFPDVQLYFQYMDWIAANEPVTPFDYSNSGTIDFPDIQILFAKV